MNPNSTGTVSTRQATVDALKAMPPGDQQAVIQEAGVQAPGRSTSDFIWRIIVMAFVVVMIGGAIALGAAIFSGNKPELLLTIFTTAAGYLAGILAPSPVQARGTSGTG